MLEGARLLAALLVVGSGPEARPLVPPDSATVGSERVVAYSFANDAAFRTDYYFTQGMSLTVVLPAFRRLPTRHLLLSAEKPATRSQYGVQVRYDGYTPLRIQDPFIRLGDRPYASYIYATLFHARTAADRRARLTTGLQVGITGPAAGAKSFQTAVHRWIDAPIPRGWDFQVRNDLVLGYELGAERQLLTAGRALEVIGTARAALSTLRTGAGPGVVVRAGLFDPYFSTLLGVATGARAAARRRVQAYVEARAEAQAVGYDATLQGGLLSRTSPYTLPARAVRRGVASGSGALVLAAGGFSIRGVAAWVSPEFRGARQHAWGQIELRAAF
ncbi:MAG: lipid A deacylase LpxR family protein [Hymenobacteraceae bacterium]|nr:lipid A deacylase LpxR family protein [Hymenobacteraceae bacterium]